MRNLLSVLVAAAFMATPALSQGFQPATPLKRLDTADDTRGWEAVGRLNFGNASYCTGALIADDLVLTAAHCLYNARTGEMFRPDQVAFMAGWRNGRASAERGVSRMVTHPDFTFSADDRISRVAHDVALLRLDRPIRNPAMTPYAVDDRPRKGADVDVVSYARDRSDAPSLQEACRVLARQGGVLVLSCEVDHGASGSPIFVTGDDGVPRIVSVVSAMAKVRETDVALGTALVKPLAELREHLAMAPEEIPQVARQGAPTVRVFGQGSGGAKFVKPES